MAHISTDGDEPSQPPVTAQAEPAGSVPSQPPGSAPAEMTVTGPACVVPLDGDERFRHRGDVEVGLDPEGVVVDPRTGLAYVACSRSDSVAVVDLQAMVRVAVIPVGREPIDIVVDPVTRRAFTADARSDQLSVIDLDEHRVVGTVAVGSYPAGLAIDPDGRRLYCGDTMGSTVSVVDVDALLRLHTVPAELGAGAVAVDPGRERAYCVNFVGSSMTVIDSAVAGGGPQAVVRRVPLGEGACAVAVNPALPEVYAVNSLASTVARVGAESGDVLGELAVPNAPVGLAVGPAGDRMYVANRGDGSVSILGVDGRQWARIPVGTAPGGVAVHPLDPRLVLVANAGSGTLTVFEDLLDGPPSVSDVAAPHPLVGHKLPAFRLPDVDGVMHDSLEWAQKRYIVNFFASW